MKPLLLAYDGALRLTNEVFYSSGGSPQWTNTYGYDTAGSRIRFSDANGSYTNTIQPGYQVTQVNSVNNGAQAESYTYDTGGRVTVLSNAVRQLKCGFNTADQLTAVTNGISTCVYTYDGAGRRVKAVDDGSTQRVFMVAPTGGVGLESPLLLVNASGDLQQGYVYVAETPLFRFDSVGNITYYLEDASGSVIGLTPDTAPSSANTTRLFYDGFGRAHGTNGPAPNVPTGAGGDFRFQHAWLEFSTEIYHMRARDYDPHSGRFLSRDPVDGDIRMPESLNPYAFALNNPYIYSDRSGQFTLVEINLTTAIQFILHTMKTIAVEEAKSRALSTVEKGVVNIVKSQLPYLGFPLDLNKAEDLLNSLGPLRFGVRVEDVVKGVICYTLRKVSPSWGKYMHNNVLVVNSGPWMGTPVSKGDSCGGMENPPVPAGLAAPFIGRLSKPDIIIGRQPLWSPSGRPKKIYLDGEVKGKASTFTKEYFLPGSNSRQLKAINAYARKYSTYRVSLFVVGLEDEPPKNSWGKKIVKRKVDQVNQAVALTRGVANGVVNLYVPMVPLGRE